MTHLPSTPIMVRRLRHLDGRSIANVFGSGYAPGAALEWFFEILAVDHDCDVDDMDLVEDDDGVEIVTARGVPVAMLA